jgi:hypothetical protein
MRITLELEAEAARALQRPTTVQPLPAAAAELRQLAATLGLDLRPLHPGVADPRLATYFFADVADVGALDQLRSCTAVVAAYAKPAEAAPR